jgi:hypothetical protein
LAGRCSWRGAGLVLEQFRGAGIPDQQHLRLVALAGGAQGAEHQLRRVAAEIARLEGGVGDRRAVIVALDHGEQQVRVGVALRRVQHQVHTAHGVRDADGADVRRSFVGPERQLHAPQTSSELRLAQQRTAEQAGEVAGLLEALDRAEDQLDGPLRAQSLGLQRVGDARGRRP